MLDSFAEQVTEPMMLFFSLDSVECAKSVLVPVSKRGEDGPCPGLTLRPLLGEPRSPFKNTASGFLASLPGLCEHRT